MEKVTKDLEILEKKTSEFSHCYIFLLFIIFNIILFIDVRKGIEKRVKRLEEIHNTAENLSRASLGARMRGL